MRAALLVLLLVVAGCGVRPSGVIPGLRVPAGEPDGVLLFLLRDGAVVPVVRPEGPPSAPGQPGRPRDPSEPFALLAAGPTAEEQALGLTSEVPAEAVPTSILPDGEDGTVVRLPMDVTTLSPLATEQLACTTAPGRPVTLEGEGTSRAQVFCEI